MVPTKSTPLYVLACVVKDSQLLLSRRSPRARFNPDSYALIGGKVEPRESPSNAIIRELHEELGLELARQNITLKHVLYFRGTSTTCSTATFVVNSWQGAPVNNEPDTTDHIAWYDIAKLPDETVPRHRYIINCIQDNLPYAERGVDQS